MDDFQRDLNDCGISLLILLDLSAALDAINHQRYYCAMVLLLSEQVDSKWKEKLNPRQFSGNN